MSVGGADHLLDDTLILAARWAAAGNTVDLFVAPELPHGFPAFRCGLTREWAARTDAWFAGILADRS
jgi:acetyl esterase